MLIIIFQTPLVVSPLLSHVFQSVRRRCVLHILVPLKLSLRSARGLPFPLWLDRAVSFLITRWSDRVPSGVGAITRVVLPFRLTLSLFQRDHPGGRGQFTCLLPLILCTLCLFRVLSFKPFIQRFQLLCVSGLLPVQLQLLRILTRLLFQLIVVLRRSQFVGPHPVLPVKLQHLFLYS